MPRVAAIHQPECFPWLGFLDKARQADVFIFLDNVQYEKNYFHNRNKIRTADGWTWLTVPAATSGRASQSIAEVEIHPTALPRWREKHLSSWRQTYGPARFGPVYLPALESLYSKKHLRLADFNVDVIRWLFEAFEIRAETELASRLPCSAGPTERLVSLCRAVGADVYLSGVSGKDYLDEGAFSRAGIELRYQRFFHPVYEQRYSPFIPCMTSLDLLFNHGREAGRILASPSVPRLETVFS